MLYVNRDHQTGRLDSTLISALHHGEKPSVSWVGSHVMHHPDRNQLLYRYTDYGEPMTINHTEGEPFSHHFLIPRGRSDVKNYSTHPEDSHNSTKTLHEALEYHAQLPVQFHHYDAPHPTQSHEANKWGWSGRETMKDVDLKNISVNYGGYEEYAYDPETEIFRPKQ